MRTMMKMNLDVETSNAAVKDGRLAKVLAATMERIKPEAAYFTAVDGGRGGYIFFDLKEPSDIIPLCEPFFLELGAKIELVPVMTIDDVQAGLGKALG